MIFDKSLKLVVVLFIVVTIFLGGYVFFGAWFYYQYSVVNFNNFSAMPNLAHSFDYLDKKIKNYFTYNVNDDIICDYNLEVTKSDLYKLNFDLPESGREYVDGVLYNKKGDNVDVKTKYRGDTGRHWYFDRKSFRINFKKVDKFDDFYGEVDFVVQESSLNDYFSAFVSKKYGILTPKISLVKFCLNGESQGLYLTQRRFDEYFLEENGKKLGSIYDGENILNIGTEKDLFENYFGWKDQLANNNRKGPEYYDLYSLLELVDVLNDEGAMANGIMTLYEKLDREKFVIFTALQTLFQTHHYDFYHNIKMYKDPSTGKFEQLYWDPVAWSSIPYWSAVGVRMDIASNKLLTLVHRDPYFVQDKYAVLYRMIKSGIFEDIELLVDKISIEYADVLDKDFLMSSAFIKTSALENLIALGKRIADEKKLLLEKLSDMQICYEQNGDELYLYSFGTVAAGFNDMILYPGRIIDRSFANGDQVYFKDVFLLPAALKYTYKLGNMDKVENIAVKNMLTDEISSISVSEKCNVEISDYTIYPYNTK